jgi:hypothetical protein
MYIYVRACVCVCVCVCIYIVCKILDHYMFYANLMFLYLLFWFFLVMLNYLPTIHMFSHLAS